MRIGYLLELGEEVRKPPFNGPANHVRQVFFQLEKSGHEIILLARLDGRLWVSRDMADFRPVTGLSSDRGAMRFLERSCRKVQALFGLPYLGWFESRRFAAACLQELKGCDVLYERFAWMNFGGSLAACNLEIPLVLEYNGDPLADLEAKGMAPRGMQRLIAKWITRRTLRSAGYLVASGSGWRDTCIRDWAVDPDRIGVVENGTELLELLPRDGLKSFRNESPADPVTRIVYLGGFYAWHGIQILLDAVSRIVTEGIPVHLTLIGSGPGESEAREQASRLGLGSAVSFAGRMESRFYAPILAAADIGVAPYCGWPEFSGLKIFDYKAAGLASVVSGRGGRPASIVHGSTGLIVEPCDTGALVDAIRNLCGNPAFCRELGRSARLEAERNHSWERTAAALESRLRQVVARN